MEHVPDYQLCVALRELGFPQEGGKYYWVLYEGNNRTIIDLQSRNNIRNIEIVDLFRAPTVEELQMSLPPNIFVYREGNKIHCRYNNDNIITMIYNGSNMAYALSVILIWLVKDGYVVFNKSIS